MGDVIAAFTADQVERLTGLSEARLREWDRTGFFAPTFAFENRRSPYSRIYSFKDVVGLRTLAILRDTHHVTLSHLKEVAEALSAYSDAPFADLKLYVVNREVHFAQPGDEQIVGVVSGQGAMVVVLRDIWNDVRAEAEKLKHRRPEQIGRIERRRFTLHGAPMVAGTRIPVSAIQSLSADGFSCEQIIAEYPTLTPKDVRAAITEVDKLRLTA
jgi:uncharacterized protein (DUF433 family)